MLLNTPMIGKLVRTLRRERGMAQRELASKVGCNMCTINCLERGAYKTIQLQLFVEIATALGIEAWRLLRFIEIQTEEHYVTDMVACYGGGFLRFKPRRKAR